MSNDQQPTGERYFRLPRSLIESLLWARLTDAAKALLPVMASHCPPTGPRVCSAPDEVLMAEADIRRRTLQTARRQLESEGLLREIRPGVWEVLPGVEWAGAIASDRRTQRRESAASGASGGVGSAASGAKAPEAAPASAASGALAPLAAQPTGAKLYTGFLDKSSSKEERRAAAVMRLLRKELGHEDPEEVLARYVEMLPREEHSPLTVLRCYVRQSRGKDNPAGYLRCAIRESYKLWGKVQQQVIDEAIEAASRRLAAALEAALSPQDMQLLRRLLKQGSEWADSLKPRELAVRAMYRAKVEDPDVWGEDELLDLALAGVGFEKAGGTRLRAGAGAGVVDGFLAPASRPASSTEGVP